jgi:DNA repair protein RadC
MLQKGANSLSDAELLAIILQNGYGNKSAVDLGKEILKLGNHNLNELGKLSIATFKQVKGIGEAKAIAITAALELGRRRQAASALNRTVIRSSVDVAEFLRASIRDFTYEVFAVVFMNRANKVVHFEIISRGGMSGTVADPRIILRLALEQHATGIILCHNHPSGNLRPSQADIAITKKICEAGKLLDIDVRDHLIVSEEGYFSFADEGMIN